MQGRCQFFHFPPPSILALLSFPPLPKSQSFPCVSEQLMKAGVPLKLHVEPDKKLTAKFGGDRKNTLGPQVLLSWRGPVPWIP